MTRIKFSVEAEIEAAFLNCRIWHPDDGVEPKPSTLGQTISGVGHDIVVACGNPDPPTGRRGRPKGAQQRRVAARALTLIHVLSGKEGGRNTSFNITSNKHEAYGDFVSLVQDLFQILGLKGNPEHHARKAIEARDETLAKNPELTLQTRLTQG